MATFLITYDLNKSGQNYDALYKAIKAQGDYIHPLQNLWFVRSDNSVTTIRDALKSRIDSNDAVWVSLVTNWAAWGLGDTTYKWLKGKN